MKIRFRKILKVLGLGLVVLLVVLAAVAAWLVRRGWPETEGEIAVSGLTAPVEVIRDAWGVPHLYAANEPDLFFAQGYVHAQDRLWQMEFNRHVSGGRLAEMFGRPALATDRYLRTLGTRRNAERDWKLLEPRSRAILEAYARGVNAYLDTHRGRLPVEFTLLGVRPEPWTPIDSLAWGHAMGLSLAQNHGLELKRVALAAKLGEQRARQLLPPYPDNGPVIVSPAEGGYAPVEPGPETPGGPLLASLLGPPPFARGSNNWVVHGSRTRSGKPILANDTHLGLNMPSEWYENGLHGGRFDVAGFSMAGLPFVIIGHNRRIAWGITAMNGDTQDLYVETFDAQRRRYRAGNEWREPQVIREEIPLKNGGKETLEVVVTRHGPIVNDVMDLQQSPPMALRWAAADGIRLFDALARLNLAGDWASFRQALSFWGSPTLNFVYADVDGNIGYQAAGNIPMRSPGHQGLLPVPGTDGGHDWRGYVPFAEMPSVLNPKAGFVASANNKVVADSYRHFIAHDYADPYRAQRITEVLAAGRKVTVDDMKRLQADTLSPTAPKLRPLLKAVKPEDDLQRRALEQIERWDGRMAADSPGATVFYAWYFFLMPGIVEDELGDELARSSRGMIFAQTPLFLRLMEKPDDPWFDDVRTAGKETRDDIVRGSFAQAVRWLGERLGGDPAEWRWGRLHRSTFTHQPFGQTGIGPLMRLFNGQSLPLPGEAFTVSAATPALNPNRPFLVSFGPSQRLIVDLSDLARSHAVNSTGQNQQLFHKHREDQIPLWARNEYRPMLHSREAVEQGAKERLRLTPR